MSEVIEERTDNDLFGELPAVQQHLLSITQVNGRVVLRSEKAERIAVREAGERHGNKCGAPCAYGRQLLHDVVAEEVR